MTTSITAAQMLAALKEWGITYKFYKPDWQSHNRTPQQGWGPLYGFIVHNFASDIPDVSSNQYLYTGDAGRQLPGPLSQFSIDDAGVVWIIGWGAANHTGSIDPRLLALVKADKAPLDRDFVPNVNFKSAGSVKEINDNFLGVEMLYGAKGPTAAQRQTVVRLAACVMDLLGTGYTGGSVVGHRECTTDRSDPQAMKMYEVRKAVNTLLQRGPIGAAPAPRPPASAAPPTSSPAKPAPAAPAPAKPTTEILAGRGGWAYDQIVEGGSVDKRLDWLVGQVTALGQQNAALAARVAQLETPTPPVGG